MPTSAKRCTDVAGGPERSAVDGGFPDGPEGPTIRYNLDVESLQDTQ